MAEVGQPDAGPVAGQLRSIEGTLLRAALLAGHGRGAAPLARGLAAATEQGHARSCMEAGAPIQLTVDAPGPPRLRVGVRLGDRLLARSLEPLVPGHVRRRLLEALASLPPADHASLGLWLFWTEARQSIYADLRDPSPEAALTRLRAVLSRAQRDCLDRVQLPSDVARPWAFRAEVDEAGDCRVHVHWLVGRHASPRRLAESMAPGGWEQAIDVLRHLLRRPGESGRWLLVTPLDDGGEPLLRIGNTGWTLVPEDAHKHRAVGNLMRALGGPADYAEALWSMCRGYATPEWRVGRACEIQAGADHVRARLFFSPDISG